MNRALTILGILLFLAIPWGVGVWGMGIAAFLLFGFSDHLATALGMFAVPLFGMGIWGVSRAIDRYVHAD